MCNAVIVEIKAHVRCLADFDDHHFFGREGIDWQGDEMRLLLDNGVAYTGDLALRDTGDRRPDRYTKC